jgi:putative tricarboxylic transport membrane protein
MNTSTTIANKPALVVGIALILVAILTAYDASTMNIRSGYGIGPQATSYLVAAILAILGLCHLPVALKRLDGEVPAADWKAVGWVGAALASLIGVIAAGGGFILGSTLLFMFTARAFGRKNFVVDFIIGFVIAVLIFLLFNKLLSLSLPSGPLERLF